MSIASRPYTQAEQHYSILLIITDGVINDMDATVGAVVAASTKPLSIIIVGVGSADFALMEKLDADDEPLVHKGVKMSRDIVQFIPFRKFRTEHPSRLAAETLAEVPGQVLSWAKLQNIKPGAPRKEQPGYGLESKTGTSGPQWGHVPSLQSQVSYTNLHGKVDSSQPSYRQDLPLSYAPSTVPTYQTTTTTTPQYQQPYQQPLQTPTYQQPLQTPTYQQPLQTPSYQQPISYYQGSQPYPSGYPPSTTPSYGQQPTYQQPYGK